MWTFRSLIGLIRRRIIDRKLSLFAFKDFLFEGIFVGLSCMKTVIIDRVSFLVAEGACHSWTESRFSAERWGRRNGVSAGVIQLLLFCLSFVAVGTALSVRMRV